MKTRSLLLLLATCILSLQANAKMVWEKYDMLILEPGMSRGDTLLKAEVLRHFNDHSGSRYEKLFLRFLTCPHSFSEFGQPEIDPEDCSFIGKTSDFIDLTDLRMIATKQEVIAAGKEGAELIGLILLTGGIGALIRSGIKKVIQRRVVTQALGQGAIMVSDTGILTIEVAALLVLERFIDPFGAEDNREKAREYSVVDYTQYNAQAKASSGGRIVKDIQTEIGRVEEAYSLMYSNVDEWESVDCPEGYSCKGSYKGNSFGSFMEGKSASQFMLDSGFSPMK